ncbi:hypothetical protein LEMLEM_LOCUS8589 [Lemmus lemmus]
MLRFEGSRTKQKPTDPCFLRPDKRVDVTGY